MPPELSGMVPRDVHLSAMGRAVAALVTVLVVASLGAVIVMAIAVVTAVDRRERAVADARTVAVERTRGDHPRRIVRYEFEVDGRSFAGRTRLRQADQRTVLQGTSIPVEYVVSDPGVNWVRGYEPRGVPLWTIPLVSGVLLIMAAAIARELRRSWVLLSEGRAVQARVLSQKKVTRDKHTAYQITCEFRDLSGARHTMRYDDTSKAPPAVGAALTVVYHRDDPRRHAVYPFQLVRPTRAPEPARRRRASFVVQRNR
jgi:hypothetical protein